MCRIAGIIGAHQQQNNIEIFRDAMSHGGPDDRGLFIDAANHIALGHRRLSLIDLSEAGHQPMFDDEQQIVLVFNGEIYNFHTLKSQLQQKGYTFRSHSDSEVIIYAYKHWGADCFRLFNGMFALALYDVANKKIMLARDHAGIKPLYFALYKQQFFFASEIRAFKTLNPDWPVNEQWKIPFLAFGHLPEPFTTLQHVQPLAKGNVLELNVKDLSYKINPFQQFQYKYAIADEGEAVLQVRQKLKAAVQRHLISDAPIGLFLSGGIDSSLLTIIAKNFVGEQLKTLSIVFEDEKFSEKMYQDIIIQQTKAHHESFVVTGKIFEDSLQDILNAMDQPSTDGINSYFISKYAKEYGLKAVLSGLGADELFGGYPSFYKTDLVKQLKQLPAFILKNASLLPNDKLKRISFLQQKENIVAQYLFNRGFFTPKQISKMLYCSEDEVWRILLKMYLPDANDLYDEQEKVSFLETNLYMQNQLLKDTDYMSMWHSVEVRVPFLDKELMQLAYSIHPGIKFNQQQKKHLLIKAFKDELPEAIWKRPKQGFTFPFEKWMYKIQLGRPDTFNDQLRLKLKEGKIHWSKYWAYQLVNR
ncbi:MAG: asparagine synthase (glutamine-hydrolyzing) [Sphingobacteriia bacterium]|nr:asparagine synthase (glutamine-hydrolyzing) [Sphingobacteriia bacterium]